MTANLTILVVVKEPSRDHIKQYRDHQGTILGTVKELNNVVRVSFSLSILKLAEVRDCNDSMRKVVVILLNHELQFVIYCFCTRDI
jgi:hypothetical protein